MSDLEWLDPDELRVFRALVRSTRALYVQFDRDLEGEAGVPRTYFEILWWLDKQPTRSLRMSDLAELTGSQASRITHAVSRLEDLGYVSRTNCAEDRRGWYAVLTEAGSDKLRVASPVYAASVRRNLLERLSRAQREQLARIGETILAGLDMPHFPSDLSTSPRAAERPAGGRAAPEPAVAR